MCRLRLATLLQFCLPGVPCIYYGDEAGMEGYRDPFNRGCYCLLYTSTKHMTPLQFRQAAKSNAEKRNAPCPRNGI